MERNCLLSWSLMFGIFCLCPYDDYSKKERRNKKLREGEESIEMREMKVRN